MGYYGFHNIGDDIFLRQLINYLSKNNIVNKIFVFCQSNYYPQSSDKVTFFNSAKLSKVKRALIILNSDYLVWGGGTLNITDEPKNLLRLQKLAKLTRKRFGFLGVGLEAVNSGEQDKKAQVFKNADLLYLRDKNSYQFALQNFNQSQKCFLGGDLAFLDLSPYKEFIEKRFANQKKSNQKIINKNSKSHQIKNISFSGMYWWGESRGEFYAQQLKPFIDKYNSVIHLLPAHVGDERNDNKFHKLLKKYLPEENCQLHSWDKPEDFLEILSQMDFHFGKRLHSIILADILGVPSVGISDENSKVKHYLDKSNMLSEYRRLDFMEPIQMETIEKIFQKYERPNEFILQENQTSRQGIELIFK